MTTTSTPDPFDEVRKVLQDTVRRATELIGDLPTAEQYLAAAALRQVQMVAPVLRNLSESYETSSQTMKWLVETGALKDFEQQKQTLLRSAFTISELVPEVEAAAEALEEAEEEDQDEGGPS